MDDDEEDKPMICDLTKQHCTGLYCEDYGCAKKAGFFDDEEAE